VLPVPTTFAEGQRAIYGWLMAGLGIFCGIAFASLIVLLWRGFTPDTEAQRLAYIALLGAGFPVGMLSVIVALAVGGPVGRFKLDATKDGLQAEADSSSTT
jgi:hypothetical protein